MVVVQTKTDDGEIATSEERDCGRFWTVDEIKGQLGKDVYTTNFENEFEQYILKTL